MRKIVLSFLFISTISFSQEFQGKAIYKTHRKMNVRISQGKNAPNATLQKQIHEQLKRQFQKTYTLQFTKSESTYKENKQLAPPQPQNQKSSVQITISSSSDLLYKNTAKSLYKKEKEISGKRFLIKDELPKDEWKLTSETKKIGNYTCYKATKTKEITRKSYVNTDGTLEETEKKETLLTTVWYTLQIPVINGPEMFGGLPGLILEVKEGKRTIVCSEIVLNTKGTIKIQIPKKGKKVTQKEFDNIMKKHTKEMFERLKNRKFKKGERNIIRITN